MVAVNSENRGSLIAVGTGIRTVGQMTMEAVAWLRRADKVLYVVADPVAEQLVASLNPAGAESLAILYAEGKPRIDTYHAMVDRMLECVRSGLCTCVALYGHPGVFAYPAHEAIRRARVEGFEARMLPGISAEDCLFADLGIDPAMTGAQSYEATDFLMNGRRIDPSSVVILWQIGVIGDWTFKRNGYDLSAMPLLIERLCQIYPPDHVAYVYEAPIFPGCPPVIRPTPIRSLAESGVTAVSTLCLPPSQAPQSDPAIWSRLQIPTQ